uniref:Membrane spanning 4-domains A2 n=1 Tax=Ictidomys tridecemlineatus TaxID=43179 RepID=A0A287D306_ICTTR
MDPENTSRADLALPNPQGPSSAPEIEVLELGTPTAPPPPKTWLTFLKRELQFLGVMGICENLHEDDGCFVASFTTIPDDRLYEELNIYSPIYSELEEKIETSSPTSS